MANLRPEVRKALEGLLSGTSKGLNDVLKISNDMLPVEREEIANVLFEEMNKDEKLDKKILKAYVEFMIASNLTLEAKNCLMSIPASKFETGNIGTISQLFDKLENKDRGELADYLAMGWNVTFSCGRGSTAYYYHRCEAGNSAPCILNPAYYLP